MAPPVCSEMDPRHACRNVGSDKLAGRGCTCVQFLSGLLRGAHIPVNVLPKVAA